MLKKQQRISRTIIESLKEQKKVVVDSLFFLNYTLDKGQAGIKIGFSVPKKVSNKAVVRNKLRRIGYSIVKGMLSDFTNGSVLHFVYRKEPRGRIEAEESIRNLIQRASLIKK